MLGSESNASCRAVLNSSKPVTQPRLTSGGTSCVCLQHPTEKAAAAREPIEALKRLLELDILPSLPPEATVDIQKLRSLFYDSEVERVLRVRAAPLLSAAHSHRESEPRNTSAARCRNPWLVAHSCWGNSQPHRALQLCCLGFLAGLRGSRVDGARAAPQRKPRPFPVLLVT